MPCIPHSPNLPFRWVIVALLSYLPSQRALCSFQACVFFRSSLAFKLLAFTPLLCVRVMPAGVVPATLWNVRIRAQNWLVFLFPIFSGALKSEQRAEGHTGVFALTSPGPA